MARPINRHLKFAVMNRIAAVVFMIFGTVVTYLGRNDPPEPILVGIFTNTLFLVCPATLLLTAATLFRSRISWATPLSTALNWMMCAFAVLFTLVLLLANGFNLSILLGICILFLPFAINIHALYEHRLDPTSLRVGEYVEKK